MRIQDKTGEGHQRLWGWFGLSYASFLTLPRVLMHEMPDDWQGKMADLLDEYDAAFPNMPDMTTSVVAKRRNKFIRMPEWIKNYRRPDFDAIAELKQREVTSTARIWQFQATYEPSQENADEQA